MTIQELYDYAIKHGCLNAEIEIIDPSNIYGTPIPTNEDDIEILFNKTIIRF